MRNWKHYSNASPGLVWFAEPERVPASEVDKKKTDSEETGELWKTAQCAWVCVCVRVCVGLPAKDRSNPRRGDPSLLTAAAAYLGL